MSGDLTDQELTILDVDAQLKFRILTQEGLDIDCERVRRLIKEVRRRRSKENSEDVAAVNLAVDKFLKNGEPTIGLEKALERLSIKATGRLWKCRVCGSKHLSGAMCGQCYG